MKQRVYIETTIVSYLTAKPSKEPILRDHQDITREWWSQQRGLYDLYASQFVLDEAAMGDPEAAKARLDILSDMLLVPLTAEVVALAEEIVEEGLLPQKAGRDAAHLAMATVHNLDIVLTWNCRHLTNGAILARVGRFVRRKGYEMPIVCTPDELMGDPGDLGE